MAEICTCGAQLPPDALFCHKCGKPQREIAPEESEQQPAPVVIALPEILPAEAPPLNFRNLVAVRIGLMLAVGATVLTSYAPFVNWLLAGFFAVFLYRRRTGMLLNVGAGMKIGWITGLLAFALAAVVALSIQLPAVFSGTLANTYVQQMKNLPIQQDPAAVQQLARFLETGPGMAVMMFGTLFSLFVFITFLCIAGGALGAKLVGGSGPASR